MNQKINYLALIVSIGCLLTLFLMTSCMVLEKSPVYFPNVPFPVNTNIKAGDILYFTVERCNTQSYPVSYQFTQTFRNIETGREYYLPSGTSVAPIGCDYIEDIPKQLPQNMISGLYILRFDLVVPGTFRTHSFSIQTKGFYVNATEANN